jgi:hypothetical protein
VLQIDVIRLLGGEEQANIKIKAMLVEGVAGGFISTHNANKYLYLDKVNDGAAFRAVVDPLVGTVDELFGTETPNAKPFGHISCPQLGTRHGNMGAHWDEGQDKIRIGVTVGVRPPPPPPHPTSPPTF